MPVNDVGTAGSVGLQPSLAAKHVWAEVVGRSTYAAPSERCASRVGGRSDYVASSTSRLAGQLERRRRRRQRCRRVLQPAVRQPYRTVAGTAVAPQRELRSACQVSNVPVHILHVATWARCPHLLSIVDKIPQWGQLPLTEWRMRLRVCQGLPSHRQRPPLEGVSSGDFLALTAQS